MTRKERCKSGYKVRGGGLGAALGCQSSVVQGKGVKTVLRGLSVPVPEDLYTAQARNYASIVRTPVVGSGAAAAAALRRCCGLLASDCYSVGARARKGVIDVYEEKEMMGGLGRRRGV